MKILKLSVVAFALVVSVAASAFTAKDPSYFWFDTDGTTYLNRTNTILNEESFLHGQTGLSYNQNSSGGTLIEKGFLTNPPSGTEQDLFEH